MPEKVRSSSVRWKNDAETTAKDDQQQIEMNKFRKNLRRFEEERRRFEVEREKFEKEKHDLVEKQRCRRLVEFERKRAMRQLQEAKVSTEYRTQLNGQLADYLPSNGMMGGDTTESDIFKPTVIRRKSQGSMLDRYTQRSVDQTDAVPIGNGTASTESTVAITSSAHPNDKPKPQSLLHRILFGKRSTKPKARATNNDSMELVQLKPLQDGDKVTLSYLMLEARIIWRQLLKDHPNECQATRLLRNRCIIEFIILCLFFGAGGLIFRFVEGAFENFYKCGVRRVKRDFVDQLWHSSHNLRFD